MFEKLLPVWTIRIALLCMFVTFALLLREPAEASLGKSDKPKQAEPSLALEIAKNVWLIGSFASLLHAITTIVMIHQGSHHVAFEHTANQTKDLLGIAVGSGIYFNYAFVLLWLLDSFWWIASPNSYRLRSRVFNWTIYGFLIFIAFNGSIVFETGWIRWFSIAGVVVLCVMAKKRF